MSDGYSGGGSSTGGTGDLVGPASAVDGKVVLFNGTTGKLVKDSGLGLSGSNTGDQTKASLGLGSVDNTADVSKPVSTAQQTALDLKANLAGPTFTGTVAGVTKTMVGLGSVDNTSDAGKPISTLTQTALDGKQALDTDLTTIAGLTATTDNFMVAAASAWASRTPTQAKTSLALVKGDVGLGNVDNTSDVLKPISTATQTALNAKQDTLVSATNIKTINGASVLGSGDLTVTSAASDVALTKLSPTANVTVTAGYSAVAVRSYTVASGKILAIGSLARMRIL